MSKQRAHKFFSMIYNILIDKCSSYNSFNKNDVILELHLEIMFWQTLKKKKMHEKFFQTSISSNVKMENKNELFQS